MNSTSHEMPVGLAKAATPRTLAVLQPGYLPWLGFFDQLIRSDVFVLYDDVQFDKHGWRNRNRVKAKTGPVWLTVPVRHKGLEKPAIQDIEIVPGGWARKHMMTLRQLYAHAPHAERYLPELEALLSRPYARLVDLDIDLILLLAGWLGIERQVVRSSELGIQGDRCERLLALCQHFDANRYLSGNAAQDYLDESLFRKHQVQVVWQDYTHPVYAQQHGDFIPFLSVIDLLLNCGEESRIILECETRSTETQ
jgi:hypothetical protein